MLLNKKACKTLMLDESKKWRNGKFTRVSADVYPYLEAILRKEIESLVKRHPTIGKTIGV